MLSRDPSSNRRGGEDDLPDGPQNGGCANDCYENRGDQIGCSAFRPPADDPICRASDWCGKRHQASDKYRRPYVGRLILRSSHAAILLRRRTRGKGRSTRHGTMNAENTIINHCPVHASRSFGTEFRLRVNPEVPFNRILADNGNPVSVCSEHCVPADRPTRHSCREIGPWAQHKLGHKPYAGLRLPRLCNPDYWTINNRYSAATETGSFVDPTGRPKRKRVGKRHHHDGRDPEPDSWLPRSHAPILPQ